MSIFKPAQSSPPTPSLAWEPGTRRLPPRCRVSPQCDQGPRPMARTQLRGTLAMDGSCEQLPWIEGDGGSDHPPPPAPAPGAGLVNQCIPATNSHPGVKARSLLNHRRVSQAIATRTTHFPRFLCLLVVENELVGAQKGECQLESWKEPTRPTGLAMRGLSARCP